MSTRLERRKQIRQAGAKSKTLEEWKKEFLALPPVIQSFIVAEKYGRKIPISVIDEAKKLHPEYWNEEGNFEPIKWN